MTFMYRLYMYLFQWNYQSTKILFHSITNKLSSDTKLLAKDISTFFGLALWGLPAIASIWFVCSRQQRNIDMNKCSMFDLSIHLICVLVCLCACAWKNNWTLLNWKLSLKTKRIEPNIKRLFPNYTCEQRSFS